MNSDAPANARILPAAQDSAVTRQPWDGLRRFTDARIALGRAGHSLPTAAHLQFQLAHAQARDAVKVALDVRRTTRGIDTLGLETLALHSSAPDRLTYLQRPDRGRRLDAPSYSAVQTWRALHSADPAMDVCFVVADGLSALAVHSHAVAFLGLVAQCLASDTAPWRIGPVCVVEQARVAIGDEIGQGLAAQLVVVLIGERPGLSSPDSMGIYMTWAPRAGRTDAERNCISNVRTAGLSLDAAAAKLHQLMRRARILQLSGVPLKDESGDLTAALDGGTTKLSVPD